MGHGRKQHSLTIERISSCTAELQESGFCVLYMAGLDLGSASHFVSQLHIQRPPNFDETNINQFLGENNDNSHQGLELGTSNISSRYTGSRWQRGRLPGSKNKPKPTVIITRESTNTL
ncbi:AT-hook motif nuclear-localized protein 23-like [Forsythia ovata]|uniref:AT-hook motif nuclear-localized protein 23-like n=1 Tax=Forsythia ovata TaxID=205694 RepID=A0ABD1VGZ8_9LAMI